MKTFVLPQRELKASYEADVVVCGGGVAGVCAAVSAAECGKKVIIIEQFGSPRRKRHKRTGHPR